MFTCWARSSKGGWTCLCQVLLQKRSHLHPSSCWALRMGWSRPPVQEKQTFLNMYQASVRRLSKIVRQCKHPPGRSSSPVRSWCGWVLGSGWGQGSHLTYPSPSNRWEKKIPSRLLSQKLLLFCQKREDITLKNIFSLIFKPRNEKSKKTTWSQKSPWWCHQCTVQQRGPRWLLNSFPTLASH